MLIDFPAQDYFAGLPPPAADNKLPPCWLASVWWSVCSFALCPFFQCCTQSCGQVTICARGWRISSYSHGNAQPLPSRHLSADLVGGRQEIGAAVQPIASVRMAEFKHSAGEKRGYAFLPDTLSAGKSHNLWNSNHFQEGLTDFWPVAAAELLCFGDYVRRCSRTLTFQGWRWCAWGCRKHNLGCSVGWDPLNPLCGIA